MFVFKLQISWSGSSAFQGKFFHSKLEHSAWIIQAEYFSLQLVSRWSWLSTLRWPWGNSRRNLVAFFGIHSRTRVNSIHCISVSSHSMVASAVSTWSHPLSLTHRAISTTSMGLIQLSQRKGKQREQTVSRIHKFAELFSLNYFLGQRKRLFHI